MKTQTVTKKYSMLLFSALASLMLMTAACQKNNGGGNNNPPPVVVTPGCTVQPCVGGPGQVPLYGGTTTNGTYFQVNFQVTGDQTGNGYGTITGQVNANNFLCQMYQPIQGSYSIQGQGQMINDVFQGNISLMPLTGGTMPMNAYVTIVPSRVQGSGLFSLQLPCVTSQHDMNF